MVLANLARLSNLSDINFKSSYFTDTLCYNSQILKKEKTSFLVLHMIDILFDRLFVLFEYEHIILQWFLSKFTDEKILLEIRI